MDCILCQKNPVYTIVFYFLKAILILSSSNIRLFLIDYFTTLPVATLHNVELKDDGWMMNSKEFVRKLSCSEVLSMHLPGGTEQNHAEPRSW
jgi:hypothetical protein